MNEPNQVEIIHGEIGRRNDKIIPEIRLYYLQAISWSRFYCLQCS